MLAGHNGTCEAMASILAGDLDFTQLLAGQPFGIAGIDTAMALVNGEDPGTLVVDPIAIDNEFATGILDGSVEPPEGVDVRERLAAGGVRMRVRTLRTSSPVRFGALSGRACNAARDGGG